MAAWADIVELRLRIKDPLGVIAISTVVNEDARDDLDPPAHQTAYLQEDTGEYYVYDEDLEAWEVKNLLISDARIGTLIDLYGVAKAAPRVVRDIITELGQRLYVARTSDGAGSTDYQNLTTLYNFYKNLITDMEETVAADSGTSTGLYLRSRRVDVGGGMRG